MTLQPLPSGFPYIWGKFYFLFYQCTCWPRPSLFSGRGSREARKDDVSSPVTVMVASQPYHSTYSGHAPCTLDISTVHVRNQHRAYRTPALCNTEHQHTAHMTSAHCTQYIIQYRAHMISASFEEKISGVHTWFLHLHTWYQHNAHLVMPPCLHHISTLHTTNTEDSSTLHRAHISTINAIHITQCTMLVIIIMQCTWGITNIMHTE